MSASPVFLDAGATVRPILVTTSTRFAPIDVNSFQALVLSVLPPDAALCDHAAARYQGVWLPDRRGPIEVCVSGRDGPARGRSHSRLDQVQFRRRDLAPSDLVVVDNIPMTSLSRTWVDLAETLGVRDLVAAGDSVLRAGVTMAELEDQVQRARRRRGVVRAREAITRLDARSRSRPESCLRYVLVAGGLPEPLVNEAVVVGGEWIGEPDLQYRAARIAIEYQGEVHAEVRRMRKDITRKLDFGDVDWLVVEVGPADVFQFPERVVHRVRFELDRRLPR